MSKRNRAISETVAVAKSYEGFRSRANRVNGFGAGVGLDGQLWNDSFLATVFHEAGYDEPSLISTTAALAKAARENRLYRKPKVGDLVFYGFSSDGVLDQPHVGLVVETRDWKSDGKFRAIEAMTASGQPRGPSDSDGVYTRTRFESEVLTFVRPSYMASAEPSEPDNSVSLRPSQFQNGKTSKATVLLQTALNRVQGTDKFTRGVFDSHTQAAVRRYQRENGLLPATGQPDDKTLNRLSKDSGLFSVSQPKT